VKKVVLVTKGLLLKILNFVIFHVKVHNTAYPPVDLGANPPVMLVSDLGAK
jgi:hypothetical protein